MWKGREVALDLSEDEVSVTSVERINEDSYPSYYEDLTTGYPHNPQYCILYVSEYVYHITQIGERETEKETTGRILW